MTTMHKRWVVKIGSALLTKDGEGLDIERIQGWVAQMAQLRKQGIEVVLVSSGAVAAGMTTLGWKNRPDAMDKLQAAAAVGQTSLVRCYEDSFQTHDLHTAQILLTHDDLANRGRYLNARSAIRALLSLNIIPIVNENDTVVTDEIRFGDNDTLGALVANLIEADRLVILTDQQGLFDADPRSNPQAKLVETANASDESLTLMASGGGSLGRGGMVTKVRAAKLAARSGAITNIAAGREENVLTRLYNNESLGTTLLPDHEPLSARKQWLAGHLQTKGTLVLDQGATKALLDSGKSLLPVGVKSSSGQFLRGEVVSCIDPLGRIIARGLVNFDHQEVKKILGKGSKELNEILGFACEEELIHRDNLVII